MQLVVDQDWLSAPGGSSMLQLADAKQLKAPSIAHDDLSSPQGAVTGWLLYSTWQLQPCKCCVPCQSDRWTLLPLPPGKVAFRSQYVYMLPGPQWSHADHAIDDKQSCSCAGHKQGVPWGIC